ncbi:hypothetical protein BST27_14665 [Mycobacterium intermedium]|uniref:Uncharacterized protein n=1 Tax=Mycobacterium intermedium TaxID=28445 RepID=A0A1E3S3S7_MYCIE|nr:hypothetical protein BHQ20_28500 [Mycobacterium intermedium]OPE45304.1 hypothetical protein BV508_30115 [Mycobacterium intermedium]ORB04113.1 hypothetical protein BST27_14665 [Mycobacterium intermedium]
MFQQALEVVSSQVRLILHRLLAGSNREVDLIDDEVHFSSGVSAASGHAYRWAPEVLSESPPVDVDGFDAACLRVVVLLLCQPELRRPPPDN